jgi:hypothetical protein
MKRDDLVSEDIVSRSYRGWYCDRPCQVLGNERIACPRAGCRCPIDEAGFTDLEKIESVFVGRFTFAVAFCHVVDDRTVMRLSPLIPLQTNGGASRDCGMLLARGRVQVTDDVGIAIICW